MHTVIYKLECCNLRFGIKTKTLKNLYKTTCHSLKSETKFLHYFVFLSIIYQTLLQHSSFSADT